MSCTLMDYEILGLDNEGAANLSNITGRAAAGAQTNHQHISTMLYELIGVVSRSAFVLARITLTHFPRSVPAAASTRSKSTLHPNLRYHHDLRTTLTPLPESRAQQATKSSLPAVSSAASHTGALSSSPNPPASRAQPTTMATTSSCASTRAQRHSTPSKGLSV